MEILHCVERKQFIYEFNIIGCPEMNYKVVWELTPKNNTMSDVFIYLARGAGEWTKFDMWFSTHKVPTIADSLEFVQEAIEKSQTDTYDIIISEEGEGIKCKVCKLTSYNKHDVKNLYCGKCNTFHLKLCKK